MPRGHSRRILVGFGTSRLESAGAPFLLDHRIRLYCSSQGTPVGCVLGVLAGSLLGLLRALALDARAEEGAGGAERDRLDGREDPREPCPLRVVLADLSDEERDEAGERRQDEDRDDDGGSRKLWPIGHDDPSAHNRPSCGARAS